MSGLYFNGDRLPSHTSSAGRRRRAINRKVSPGGKASLPISHDFGQNGADSQTPVNRDRGVIVNTTVPIVQVANYFDNQIVFIGRHDQSGYIELVENSSIDAFWRADKEGMSAGEYISQRFNTTDTQSPTCRWSPFSGNTNTTLTLADVPVNDDAAGFIKVDISQVRDGWWFGIFDEGGNVSAGAVEVKINPDTANTGWTINGSNAAVTVLNTAYQSAKIMLTLGNTNWIIQRFS